MPRSILIIKPSSLGDIVNTLPAVAAIRDHEPKARITWVINPEWAPLLRGNHDIDHVHIFPRSEFRGLNAPANIFSWWRRTKMLRPDVALDFQGLLRSALIAKASGAKEILGLSDGREGSRLFYDRAAQVRRGEHAVERYLKLAELFGAPVREPIRFAIPTGDALPRFDPWPPFIVLHPFARGRGKSLTPAVIQEFCRALAPTRVVVVGKTPQRFAPPENCIDLTNQTTLLQLVWLVRTAAFLVSVDSGPMHIGAACAQRLLSIHTWTDPRRVGPYNPEAWLWKSGQVLRVSELEQAGKWKCRARFRRSDVAEIVKIVAPIVESTNPAALD